MTDRSIRIVRPKTPRSSTLAVPTSRRSAGGAMRAHARKHGVWTFPPARSNLASRTIDQSAVGTLHLGGGVMSVRRVLTVLTVVAMWCLAGVAHAAAAQPERRTATGDAAAAAAAVSVEATSTTTALPTSPMGYRERGRHRRGRRRGEHLGRVGQRTDRHRSQLLFQGGGGVTDTAEPFDFFGNALAAGDFNNNGFIDLAIGVPGEDMGTVADAGAFNVLYGSASGCRPPAASSSPRKPPGCSAPPRPGWLRRRLASGTSTTTGSPIWPSGCPPKASAPPPGRGGRLRHGMAAGSRPPGTSNASKAAAGSAASLSSATGLGSRSPAAISTTTASGSRRRRPLRRRRHQVSRRGPTSSMALRAG